LIHLRADFHVHTVLSPCADVEMIPPLIVETAIERGISLLAITDHNASANILAVQRAAQGTEVTILPGMELQTIEEVHVVCLFDSLEQSLAFQAMVDRVLPVIPNNVEYFGEQFVVDETGAFIRREDRLLLTSTQWTLRQAWEAVYGLGGLMIPAHVNRKANGLLAILGLVPDDVPIEMLEISLHTTPEQAYQDFPALKGYPLIQDGDAHFLEDIRGLNDLSLEEITVDEIRRAVLGIDGRSHRVLKE